MDMSTTTFIGMLVLAGTTLISFITTFVKVGSRFALLEQKVAGLEKNKDKTEIKLDAIQKSVNEILLRLAILDENMKNKNS